MSKICSIFLVSEVIEKMEKVPGISGIMKVSRCFKAHAIEMELIWTD